MDESVLITRAITPDRANMLSKAVSYQQENPEFVFPEFIVWDKGGEDWNLARCRNKQMKVVKSLKYDWTLILDCDCSVIKFNPQFLSRDKINRAWCDTYHGYKDNMSWWAIHKDVFDKFPDIPAFDESLPGSFYHDTDWQLKCVKDGIALNNCDKESFYIYHHPHEHNDPDPDAAPRNQVIMRQRYPDQNF